MIRLPSWLVSIVLCRMPFLRTLPKFDLSKPDIRNSHADIPFSSSKQNPTTYQESSIHYDFIKTSWKHHFSRVLNLHSLIKKSCSVRANAPQLVSHSTTHQLATSPKLWYCYYTLVIGEILLLFPVVWNKLFLVEVYRVRCNVVGTAKRGKNPH